MAAKGEAFLLRAQIWGEPKTQAKRQAKRCVRFPCLARSRSKIRVLVRNMQPHSGTAFKTNNA
jgi:hypothetical protein